MANRKMESSAANKKKPPHQNEPRKAGNRRQLKRNQPFVDPARVLQESKALEELLRQRSCLPADRIDDEQRRQNALDTLERILCEWASSILLQSNTKSNESKWRQPRVSLVTFGSYRLGVHRSESDLDVLAMSPPACSRGDFFTSLVDALQRDSRVYDVHAIPSAYTPVIKFRLNDIQIDMLFGRAASVTKLLDFQQKSPPPVLVSKAGAGGVSLKSNKDEPRREYLIDDSDLVGADDAGVRSLNGARVTQMILEMVEPNPDAFRVTLCAVKEWAIIHGVYSNILGFLGGINFAILVAWVCMRHPEQKPSTLLRIFFRTFALWEWPKPVFLCPVQKAPPEGLLASMPVWDPREHPRDAKHLMPILTPAYPSMNSAYNVGVPQLRRLQQEMIRAAKTLERGEEHWRDIFTNNDFFFRHSNFLQVTVRANNTIDFLPWQRFCESRLRLLIAALETPQVSAWPFARFFGQDFTKFGMPRKMAQMSDESCLQENHFFIALRFAPGVTTIDLRYFISDFLHKMNSWEERKEGMDLGICHILQQDLPSFVFDRPLINKVHFKSNPEKPRPSNNKKYNKNKTAQNELADAATAANNQGGGETKLTPKMGRSTLSDEHAARLQSPTKRARGQNNGAQKG